MKKLLGLAALLLLVGCSPLQQVIERLPADQLGGLTPDAIKALDNSGQAVRACLQLNGPPLAGSGTIMIVPKTDQAPVNFGQDCHPIPPPVVIQVPPAK